MAKKDRTKNGRAKRRDGGLAKKADPLKLYRDSVQCPEAEIHFFDTVFDKYRGRRARSMKEDFCGTAFLATEWVKSDGERTAIGVDLDEPTLEYAKNEIISPEKRKVRDRITLVQADVHDVSDPKVDLTCALNFSYSVFKKREQLRRYFDTVIGGLNDDGVFVLDLFGGTEAIEPAKEERKQKGFVYVWEQADYNPVTNEILCHIHFKFKDGSRLHKAFTYDWRLWTVAELRELLAEAGFSKADVYWEPDEDEAGDGEFYEYRLTEKEENQPGWLAYIVALK
jgi:hypothetical protein